MNDDETTALQRAAELSRRKVEIPMCAEPDERVGIDTKSLSRLERGAHYPSLETLERIRVELDVDLKDFFDFDQRPSAEEMRDFLIRTASNADYDSLTKMTNAVKSALSQ